jgi:hypothetical protein
VVCAAHGVSTVIHSRAACRPYMSMTYPSWSPSSSGSSSSCSGWCPIGDV